jgi:hypothetical protein
MTAHSHVDVGTSSEFADRAQVPGASRLGRSVGRLGQQSESPPSSPLGILLRDFADFLPHRSKIHVRGPETAGVLPGRLAGAVGL